MATKKTELNAQATTTVDGLPQGSPISDTDTFMVMQGDGGRKTVKVTGKALKDFIPTPPPPKPYELPIASETVLGGVKVGENLTIEQDGTLNANSGGQDKKVIVVPVDGARSAVIEPDALTQVVLFQNKSPFTGTLRIDSSPNFEQGTEVRVANAANFPVVVIPGDKVNFVTNKGRTISERGEALLTYTEQDTWLVNGDLTNQTVPFFTSVTPKGGWGAFDPGTCQLTFNNTGVVNLASFVVYAVSDKYGTQTRTVNSTATMCIFETLTTDSYYEFYGEFVFADGTKVRGGKYPFWVQGEVPSPPRNVVVTGYRGSKIFIDFDCWAYPMDRVTHMQAQAFDTSGNPLTPLVPMPREDNPDSRYFNSWQLQWFPNHPDVVGTRVMTKICCGIDDGKGGVKWGKWSNPAYIDCDAGMVPPVMTAAIQNPDYGWVVNASWKVDWADQIFDVGSIRNIRVVPEHYTNSLEYDRPWSYNTTDLGIEFYPESRFVDISIRTISFGRFGDFSKPIRLLINQPPIDPFEFLDAVFVGYNPESPDLTERNVDINVRGVDPRTDDIVFRVSKTQDMSEILTERSAVFESFGEWYCDTTPDDRVPLEIGDYYIQIKRIRPHVEDSKWLPESGGMEFYLGK